jgi:hypothetical protein
MLSHGSNVDIFVTKPVGRERLYGKGDGGCWWLRRGRRSALVSPIAPDATDLTACGAGFEYQPLFHDTVGKVDYVVVHVFEMPSGGPVQCGAQADDFVVWLAIDADLHVQRRQSVLTGSCYTNVGASVSVRDGRLEIPNESHMTVYDPHHPASGLVDVEGSQDGVDPDATPTRSPLAPSPPRT